MDLFRRKGKGLKKWRLKAMLVDPHKTRITLGIARKPVRVPPWIYKKLENETAEH